jgi:hypothetical protein
MYLVYLLPVLLQVLALVHFIKYRSASYIWLFLIIFLGPIGALVYIIVEVVPELRATHTSVGWLAKKKRLKYLEAVVEENPSAGNYEELADLHLEQKNYARARECFDRAISARTDHADPFYGRALCSLHQGNYPAAILDLEKAASFDRKHDYGRALGLLAMCHARAGQRETAEKLFREALATSTLSETQYNFACLLAELGRRDEARDWAKRILNKQATLSGPLRRLESGWVKKSKDLLKELEAPAKASAVV